MKTQKEFVEGCLQYYSEFGIVAGDPEEGIWEDAHYPIPECLGGTETILLLSEHHYIQGIYQSLEFNKVCFWIGNTKKFLRDNFCTAWFELSEAYEKVVSRYTKERLRLLHIPDESGKSLHTKKLHQQKDDQGRSVHTLKAFAKVHIKKDKNGKSVEAVKAGEVSASQVWESTLDGFQGNAGNVARHNKANGWDPSARIKVSG
jgi:hypothetical protein